MYRVYVYVYVGACVNTPPLYSSPNCCLCRTCFLRLLSLKSIVFFLFSGDLNIDDDFIGRDVIIEETELGDVIDKLHFVFVVSNDPSVMFVEHLRPVILVLMELHCKVCYGVSHLRSKVEQLVERFIKGSSGSLATRALRAFAFNEPTVKGQPDDGFKVRGKEEDEN